MNNTNFKFQIQQIVDNLNYTIVELCKQRADQNDVNKKINQELQDSRAKITELIAASNKTMATDSTKNT